MPNRLADETSPYLLQHADNPVDWYPWGEEAFAAARERPADPPLRRLLRLPLVPRHGARVLRGPGDGAPDERALRQRQGRPRGAPGRGRALHGRGAAADRPRRLADDGLPHPGRASPSTAAPTSRPSRGTGCRPSRRCWRRSSDGVPRAARRGGARARPQLRGAASSRARRCAAPPAAARRGASRAGRRAARAALRRAARRLRRRAQVPAADGPGVPAPRRGAAAAGRRRSPCVRAHARRRWRPAASTTTSAAASTATAWTRAGSCRTSRRCSTTTPSSRASTCTPTWPPAEPRYRRVAEEMLDYVLREMRSPGGRLLLRAGRRQRGRGGAVLPLERRRRWTRFSAPTTARSSAPTTT